MKKNLVAFVFIFQFTNSYAQHYQDPIDSAVASFALTGKDWVICLSIDRAGTLYDVNGNPSEGDPNGTYMLTKINNKCSLQKSSGNYYRPTINLSLPINITDSVICSYTKDSIQKGDNEFIAPYIYRDDSLGVYFIQGQSDHTAFYRMWMRTNQSMRNWTFPEVEFFTPESNLSWYKKNLNEDHNRSMFIYRAFINFSRLLKKEYKIWILD